MFSLRKKKNFQYFCTSVPYWSFILTLSDLPTVSEIFTKELLRFQNQGKHARTLTQTQFLYKLLLLCHQIILILTVCYFPSRQEAHMSLRMTCRIGTTRAYPGYFMHSPGHFGGQWPKATWQMSCPDPPTLYFVCVSPNFRRGSRVIITDAGYFCWCLHQQSALGRRTWPLSVCIHLNTGQADCLQISVAQTFTK